MRRARGVFVTGTDTGVGKTAVACALAAWCRRRGLDVGVMKPVATGGMPLRQGATWRVVSKDALRLAACAGADDPWELINPVCFREPLAPSTAAARARAPIRLDVILRAYAALRARHDVLIIEGVGGLLVPLTPRTSVADLAKRFGLPLVLVARPGLGTLNHTLLSLACIRERGLPLRGVIINHAQPVPRDPMARVAARINPQALARHTRVLGTLPFRRGVLARGSGAHQALAAWISRELGPGTLRSVLAVDIDRPGALWYSQPSVNGVSTITIR